MYMDKTEKVLIGLIGVLFLALTAVIGNSLRDRVVGVGDNAPEFSFITDEGKTITNSNFGGRLLVLNFWATWCPPCVEEMPSLNDFHQELNGSGVVVVGVSIDKNEQSYRNFLRKAGVSFATARDPEAKISSEFGTYRVPETYVIDNKGKVVQKIIGPTSWNDGKMVSYIKSLL